MGQNKIISLLLLTLLAYESYGERLINAGPFTQPWAKRPGLSHILRPAKLDGVDSAEGSASQPIPRDMSPEELEKIVGGTEITPYSWPFLVLVAEADQGRLYAICGGTIVDSTHVISAAHCFAQGGQYYILAAEHNYAEYKGNEQVIAVEKFARHPDYTDGRLPNDVAILKLSRPLTMTEQVQAIELNTAGTCPQAPSSCTVGGWGHTQYGGYGSTVPLQVDVPVQPQSVCYGVYGQFGEDQICAGQEGVDACQGDSGGPLTCECEGAKKLTGIVSYGRGCASARYPGVYARVSYFTQWITDTLANL